MYAALCWVLYSEETIVIPHAPRGQLALTGFEQALVTLDHGSERLLYTSPVTAEDLVDAESLRASPSIWQQ